MTPSQVRAGTIGNDSPARLARALTYLDYYAHVPVVSLGCCSGTRCEILAILGGAHMDTSFKNLLGMGMLVLAREQRLLEPDQPVIESSSGSMGEGLAVGGLVLGHPVTIVADPNLPAVTRCKLRLLGAELVVPPEPHPELGWQEAREASVRRLLADKSDLYWTDQNNNLMNPAVYARWLVPAIRRWIEPRDVTAAVFGVGSGGHFSSLAKWLKESNPRIRTYAADRPGSMTFGTGSGPSRLRGIGNQNMVPDVIKQNMHFVDDVIVVDEERAFGACRELAVEFGCFVGGSSGLVYSAAVRLARRLGRGTILTLFPDRGEIYADTLWKEASWLS